MLEKSFDRNECRMIEFSREFLSVFRYFVQAVQFHFWSQMQAWAQLKKTPCRNSF